MGLALRLSERPLFVRILSTVIVSLLLTIVGVLSLWRPTDLIYSPPCLWWSLTGLRCPGCGLTRALSAVLHGELGRALWLNPFILAIPPMFLGFGVFFSVAALKGRFPRLAETPKAVGVVLFYLLSCFWLYRTVVDLWSRLAG